MGSPSTGPSRKDVPIQTFPQVQGEKRCTGFDAVVPSYNDTVELAGHRQPWVRTFAATCLDKQLQSILKKG
jgi:hypothetical protein